MFLKQKIRFLDFNLQMPDEIMTHKRNEIQVQWVKLRLCERHKMQFIFNYLLLTR